MKRPAVLLAYAIKSDLAALNAVKDYTWESVSLSVAGTILGGLDDNFD